MQEDAGVSIHLGLREGGHRGRIVHVRYVRTESELRATYRNSLNIHVDWNSRMVG